MNKLYRKHHRVNGCIKLLSVLLLSLLSSLVLAQSDDGPWRADQALDTPDWFSISGEQRTRYSHLSNQFRRVLDNNDQAISLRTLLRMDVRLDQGVKLVTELQDSRAYLTDQNSAASTIVVNAAELLQAHMALGMQDVFRDGDRLDLNMGRFTMDLGGRRLVARNRFRNTIQNYTGLYADWRSGEQSRLRTFFTLPVSRLPFDRDGILNNKVKFDEEDSDLLFWGAFFERQQALFGATLEVYFFGLNESDDPGDQETRNRQLSTPGFRLLQTPRTGRWDYEFENVLQLGERRASILPRDTEDLDVFAHFHHAAIGYSFKSDWNWRLTAELDYASGEESTSDDDANRFDSLFGPRRTEFGPTGIYGILGRENIISSGLRLRFKPDSRLDGYISWRANWLDEKTDFFARSGVRDPLGQSGSFAGHQIEFRTRYWVIPDQIRYEVGAAVFLERRFLRTAPNVNENGNPLFVYTDISFFF
ncbi:MAG: alginate export family protein [Gammaproteobacteria bacterium]|nr:alginate export family protein [Gammaproteobacteria bacterium]